MFEAGGGFSRIYVGAFKDRVGKEVLSLTTSDLAELERLGYTWEHSKR